MKSDTAPSNVPKLYRLIDANINRLREGIRVAEDVVRYIYDNKEIASRLKKIRHQIRFDDPLLLQYRDIRNDVLKKSTKSEMQRETIEEIIKANMKRAQESARVLEEALKLIDPNYAELFKTIRYELYDIEKEL
ncbi:thiamine-phosphate pyrophosphorylase [Nitratiruptor sp. YY08-26]|uniref:thiamine-phosphate pyrophosphorylase n=1 Tax=unclassified Nitratiruptor TaxID=2624044 RepID=UPI001916A93A|nr:MULTISPECIES: thiamine-phosphate pyrophosphorylase [unclassified Nitratiruptor]BCD63135.1 thiamine-phosphate pyrophosphorylase [Nitratiruptor sp. YY08-13]BCD67070.1 thiamine-phosphate pyrophosphorylase [Nitratiruptor sp. YY08-26]